MDPRINFTNFVVPIFIVYLLEKKPYAILLGQSSTIQERVKSYSISKKS